MVSSLRIAQNTLYMAGSHLGARMVGLVTVMLLTRQLGVAEYGQLSLAYAYWGLAALVGEAGFDAILVREASKGAIPLAHYIGNGIVLRAALVLVIYLVALAALPWQGYDQAALPLMRLALLMLFCSPLSVARTIFLVTMQIRQVAALDLIAQLLTAAAVVWALALGGRAAEVLLLQLAATALAQLGYLVYGWRRLPPPRTFRADGAIWRLLLAQGWPLLLAALLAQSQIHTSRLVAGSMLSPGEVGLYAVASNLAVMANVLPTLYFTSVYPLLARSAGAAPAEFLRLARLSYRLLMLVALPLATLLSLTSAEVLRLYAGAGFLGAAPLLAALAWTIVLSFAGVVLYYLMLATGQERLLPRVGLAVALTQLGLLLLLLPQLGIMGAAVASLATYGLAFAIYGALPGTRPYVVEWLRQSVRPALALLPVAGAILAARPPLLVAWGGGAAAYGLIFFLIDDRRPTPDDRRLTTGRTTDGDI